MSALAVCYTPTRDEKVIDRELKKLDPELFLDKEWEPLGSYVYYVVKHAIGSGEPPLACLEWRDARGPWPLTYAIVDRLKRQEGALDGAAAWAKQRNADKAEAARAARDEQYDDVIRDFDRHRFGWAVQPRSQALRQARDRQRARGKKV